MTGPVRAAIAGWGMSVPEGRITNSDLAARGMDTSEQWILERTGIQERRILAEGECTSTLAIAAGNAAIKSAGIAPGDLGLVVVATCTPDQTLPETSCFVADGLGVTCGAFDVGAACAGFAYGMVVVSGLLGSRAVDGPVLLIGAETLTRIVEPIDRGTAILFGDGAAAAVFAPSAGGEDGPGVIASHMGADGAAASLIEIKAGGSRIPTSHESLDAGLHWMRMQGQEVFRRAVRVVVESSNLAMQRSGVTVDQIDWFVPHQANARIVAAAASRLGLPQEKCLENIDRYGNTSAASVPLVLAEAADEGKFKDGDLILVCGFGAGMAWASSVVRWGRPAGWRT